MVLMSMSRGTLLKVHKPSARIDEQSIGSAAFLDPEIVTLPRSALPPYMMNLSMNPLYDHDPFYPCKIAHPGFYVQNINAAHQGVDGVFLADARLHEESASRGEMSF